MLMVCVCSPKEHSGPQQGVQELSASEVTSLEALLGLEEGGGDQVAPSIDCVIRNRGHNTSVDQLYACTACIPQGVSRHKKKKYIVHAEL